MESLRSCLHTTSRELYITSCGSESINTAIRGYLSANPRMGRHIISTKTEHKATLESLKYLEDSGYEVTYIRVDREGIPDLRQLEESIRKDTALITLTHVNNETGSILPVKKIVGIRDRTNKQTRIHLDCVQSLGKLPIDLGNLGIDMASFSGHKIHSVKGVGLLFVKEGCRIHPLIYGGGQQNGIRSGTESPYLAGALELAVSMAEEDREKALPRVTMLKNKLLDQLSDLHPTVFSPDDALPYIVNLAFSTFSAETMLHALEEKNIYVSTVSACSSKSKKVSHVLLEMGMDRSIAQNALRISFSRFSTEDDVIVVSSAIHDIFNKYSTKRGHT
jgi:cysteine desulfurase